MQGGPASDPGRLDADGDGEASDSRPCPAVRVARHEPRTRRRAGRGRSSFGPGSDVTDGDTIKLRRGGKRYRVRLIGIDTPETRRPGTAVECGGRQATALKLLLAFTAPRDSDGGRPRNLARLSIVAGWGKVYVFEERFRLCGRFKAAQEAAKSETKGVWSLCAGDFHRPA